MKARPDAETLRGLLSYDPETGVLRWRVKPYRSSVNVGDEAGSIVTNGRDILYRQIGIGGGTYKAHSVIWCMVTGDWPAVQVDHRDNDGLNNRWINLRAATRAQNAQNRRIQSNNSSGFKGVTWSKPDGKWIAYIREGGVKSHIGMFDDVDQAFEAYCAEAVKRFGEFANFGGRQ